MMMKGNVNGSGIGSLILIAAIAFIGYKVILPKIKDMKYSSVAMAAVTELDRTFKDIRSDFNARGELRELKNMTSVRQFTDEDLNAKITLDKPFKYGVGVKSKNDMVLCADIIMRKGDDGGYYLEMYEINKKENRCKVFHKTETFKKLKGMRYSVGK